MVLVKVYQSLIRFLHVFDHVFNKGTIYHPFIAFWLKGGKFLQPFLTLTTHTFWTLPCTILQVGSYYSIFEIFPTINTRSPLGMSNVCICFSQIGVNLWVVHSSRLMQPFGCWSLDDQKLNMFATNHYHKHFSSPVKPNLIFVISHHRNILLCWSHMFAIHLRPFLCNFYAHKIVIPKVPPL
jgi:hypothetical protein